MPPSGYILFNTVPFAILKTISFLAPSGKKDYCKQMTTYLFIMYSLMPVDMMPPHFLLSNNKLQSVWWPECPAGSR